MRWYEQCEGKTRHYSNTRPQLHRDRRKQMVYIIYITEEHIYDIYSGKRKYVHNTTLL